MKKSALSLAPGDHNDVDLVFLDGEEERKVSLMLLARHLSNSGRTLLYRAQDLWLAQNAVESFDPQI